MSAVSPLSAAIRQAAGRVEPRVLAIRIVEHTKKGVYGDPVAVPGKVVRYAFWGRRTHKEEFPLHFWLACILLTIQWGNMEI